jgi:uncharacterized membrane protein
MPPLTGSKNLMAYNDTHVANVHQLIRNTTVYTINIFVKEVKQISQKSPNFIIQTLLSGLAAFSALFLASGNSRSQRLLSRNAFRVCLYAILRVLQLYKRQELMAG